MYLQRDLLKVGLAIALVTSTTAPVSAQNWVDVNRGTTYEVHHPPTVGNFIYGSPIPTPVPVNPTTGLTPSRTYHSYPHRGHKVIDSTLVNPVLINPRIRNSTLINPTIVKDSPYHSPYYRQVRPYHSPRGDRRVIITHPRTYPW